MPELELELEPALPLPWPEVLGAEGVGVVVLGALVLPEALPDVELCPDVLLPEALPEAASFMQRSFSAPRSTAHLCVSTLAPAEPLVVLDGLVEVAGLVVCELVLAPAPAEPLIEPDGAAGLVCALVEPFAPDWALVLPEVWASEAPDSARRAAAVELTRIFSIIGLLLC